MMHTPYNLCALIIYIRETYNPDAINKKKLAFTFFVDFLGGRPHIQFNETTNAKGMTMTHFTEKTVTVELNEFQVRDLLLAAQEKLGHRAHAYGGKPVFEFMVEIARADVEKWETLLKSLEDE